MEILSLATSGPPPTTSLELQSHSCLLSVGSLGSSRGKAGTAAWMNGRLFSCSGPRSDLAGVSWESTQHELHVASQIQRGPLGIVLPASWREQSGLATGAASRRGCRNVPQTTGALAVSLRSQPLHFVGFTSHLLICTCLAKISRVFMPLSHQVRAAQCHQYRGSGCCPVEWRRPQVPEC